MAAVAVTVAILHAAAAASAGAGAQDVRGWLARGDQEYDARNPVAALVAYDSVLARNSTHHEALWKAARSAIDLGEYERNEGVAQAHFARARTYAERAVAADSASSDGYFQLSRALGRLALASGPRERVRLATTVRQLALDAITRLPDHPGALHVLGVWHAEVMRLSRFERTMARTFLGGKVLSEANWKDAAAHLERSAAIEPERIVHRLDLARVYRDTGRKDLARALLEWIARAPVTDYNDPHYKEAAANELRRLK